MFCPSCGKQIEESDTFCRYCGNSTKPGAPVSPGSAPVAQVQLRNVYAGKKLQVIGAIIMIIGLFVMMGSCLNASPNDSDWAWTFLIPLTGAVILIWGGVKHWRLGTESEKARLTVGPLKTLGAI